MTSTCSKQITRYRHVDVSLTRVNLAAVMGTNHHQYVWSNKIPQLDVTSQERNRHQDVNLITVRERVSSIVK